MRPITIDTADVLRTLPFVAALEALDAWHREPTGENLAAFRERLGRLVEAAGGRGAYLDIDAPPLPLTAFGVGSLERHVGSDADGAHERFDLSAGDPPVRLATLVIDAPAATAAATARVLEVALHSAWSRAVVGATVGSLEALDEATRAIGAELDVDRVLQLIVERVRDLVRAEYAALGIVDRTGRIERFLTSGITPEERARIGSPPQGHGLLGMIIREGRSIRVPDILAHPDSHGFPPHHPPMRSLLGVPIVVKGRPIGDLYLTDKAGDEPFTDQDQRVVEMFAVHAGIAIENARLHDQVHRLAIVEERERIGKDLHDGIIQSIYAVGLSLEDVPELMSEEPEEAVARIDRAVDALNLVIADIRDYILRLRPTLGAADPVFDSLAHLVDEFGLVCEAQLDLDIDEAGRILRRLAPDRRSDLLFIAREALSNVVRHAGARRVQVRFRDLGDEAVEMTVEDDGRGFDPDLVPPPDAAGRHQGRSNMRDRAVGSGGTCVIDSRPGAGTRIIVRLPASPGSATPADAGGAGVEA